MTRWAGADAVTLRVKQEPYLQYTALSALPGHKTQAAWTAHGNLAQTFGEKGIFVD